MNKSSNMRARWNDDWNPDEERFKRQSFAFNRAIDVAEEMAKKVSELAANKLYSDEGRRDILRKWMKENVLQRLDQARSFNEIARNSLNQELVDLARFNPGAGDVIGALRRQEIRSWLRSKKSAEIHHILLDKRTSLEVIDAVLDSADSRLFGMTTPIFDRLRNRVIDRKHPGRIDGIQQGLEAANLADLAIYAATSDIQNASGFSATRGFKEWLEAA